MNDNDVWQIIIALIRAQLDALGLTTVAVKQSYQPTQQGVPEGPAVFIHKIDAKRYGHPGSRSVYNMVDDDFDTTESIWRNPTFQVNGLSVQDPTDTTQLTASDIVEITADILQSRSTRATLLASGIGILRIADVRVLYFVNDRDRHEQEPSFDFTLSYRRTTTFKTPVVTGQQANIQRV